VAFAAWWGTKAPATVDAATNTYAPTAATIGPVFALFVIAVAAAEVGVGLALILMLFRNRRSIDIDELDLMKG
jgi:NADH:ubiquinone oxidoreductase subunit K